jgi:hypothetical protein
MTPIQNIRIARLGKKGGLIARAARGTYMSAQGHPSQLIAENAKNESGKALEIGAHYSIAAVGMPTTANFRFEHINDAPTDGKLFVFIETRV